MSCISVASQKKGSVQPIANTVLVAVGELVPLVMLILCVGNKVRPTADFIYTLLVLLIYLN